MEIINNKKDTGYLSQVDLILPFKNNKYKKSRFIKLKRDLI